MGWGGPAWLVLWGYNWPGVSTTEVDGQRNWVDGKQDNLSVFKRGWMYGSHLS